MTIETLTSKIKDVVISLNADEVTDDTTISVDREYNVEAFEAELNTYAKVAAIPVRYLYDFEADEFKAEALNELAMDAFNRFGN